ncbi:MAG TPA: OB-fold domain-containing protein [Leptospiraceae bacterium]|nr:OB-fold domain-containing protein [Leptospiraceae bacterium]HNF16841.1 OB-fold domain-containing protein [Leptospiraceae bacterium]HNF24047.1 OB-fold domain-containing protein [Leptospiraceae bacterium]HNI97479.1 OB-fold domain-containing protein [Leptospiraceae bacterium]HNM04535.1 OB-fold domain-containing protein [Leptospiraceae bacterium]
MEAVMEKLVGKKCNSCGQHMLNPSFACANCGSDAIDVFEFKGTGEIYTFTVVMVGFGHLAPRAPYVLAIVSLEEGLKVLTIVEDLDKDKASIGIKVKFKRWEEGTGPIFTVL